MADLDNVQQAARRILETVRVPGLPNMAGETTLSSYTGRGPDPVWGAGSSLVEATARLVWRLGGARTAAEFDRLFSPSVVPQLMSEAATNFYAHSDAAVGLGVLLQMLYDREAELAAQSQQTEERHDQRKTMWKLLEDIDGAMSLGSVRQGVAMMQDVAQQDWVFRTLGQIRAFLAANGDASALPSPYLRERDSLRARLDAATEQTGELRRELDEAIGFLWQLVGDPDAVRPRGYERVLPFGLHGFLARHPAVIPEEDG